MGNMFRPATKLQPTDLHLLDEWCRDRGLHWAAAASHEPSLMLEPASPTRAWQRMVLQLGYDAMRLRDESGELLAEASELPALLDAVDGGVAGPVRAQLAPVAASCVGMAVNVVL